MKIGVDGSCWANARGYGRFARELMRTLVVQAPDDEFVFFLDPAAADGFDLAAPNVRVHRVLSQVAPTEAARADGHRSLSDMFRFTRAVSREPLDVFFSPSVYTYFPLPPGRRAVVGIHDAIAERFPQLTLPSRRARLFWKAKVSLAVRQSTLILSVSDFAADDVARHLDVDRSRIRVAVEAPAPVFRPGSAPATVAATAARYGIPEGAEWFIYVGGFNPHKNLVRLIRAYARVVGGRSSETTPCLALVGTLTGDGFHRNTEQVHREIEEAGLDRVVWTGFVPDEDLRHLYAGAVGAVLPSECEGFGLPAVEAAACGTAVIATTESPLPTLLAGGGIFVDPADEVGLGDAMARFLDEPARRDGFATIALRRAEALSWERCAQETLAALREAATR